MKNILKLSGLIAISGCTINFITPTETTTPSASPTQQPVTQATELPDNLNPANTGSNVNTTPAPAGGRTNTTSSPTSNSTKSTTSSSATPASTVNNAPAPPASTPPPTPSTEITATPLPGASATPVPNAPVLPESETLEAPKSLRTSNIEETSVTITWKASTNADYYRVYQDGILIGDNINQLQYTANNLNPGLNYEFQVSAVSSQGEESPKSRALGVGFF